MCCTFVQCRVHRHAGSALSSGRSSSTLALLVGTALRIGQARVCQLRERAAAAAMAAAEGLTCLPAAHWCTEQAAWLLADVACSQVLVCALLVSALLVGLGGLRHVPHGREQHMMYGCTTRFCGGGGTRAEMRVYTAVRLLLSQLCHMSLEWLSTSGRGHPGADSARCYVLHCGLWHGWLSREWSGLYSHMLCVPVGSPPAEQEIAKS